MLNSLVLFLDAGEDDEEEKPRRSVQELAKSLSLSIIPQSHLPGASTSLKSSLESGVSIEEAAQVNILPSNIKVCLSLTLGLP